MHISLDVAGRGALEKEWRGPRGSHIVFRFMDSSSKFSRTAFRGFRQRLRLLSLVVGLFVALAGLVFVGVSFTKLEPQRGQLLELGAWAGAAGLALIVLRAMIFVLPDFREMRRSPSHQLRKGEYGGRRKRGVPARSRDGGVLVLMLVLTGLVAALLLQSQALARARSARDALTRERAELRLAATEGVRAALRRLADDEDLGVDTTNEAWAATLDLETPLGLSTRVRVRDEQARFDLNNLAVPSAPGQRSSEDAALDLQTLCGEFAPTPRTEALRDFIDDNNAGAKEADFYLRREPPSRCPDRVLYGWRELMEVDGWDTNALARRPLESTLRSFDASLVDNVTLLPLARSRPLAVNINTASRETLRAVVGLENDTLVDTILTLRAIRPIRQLDVFAVAIGADAFERIRPLLDVRSRYFRIESAAESRERRLTLFVLATRQDDGRVEIVQWAEAGTS